MSHSKIPEDRIRDEESGVRAIKNCILLYTASGNSEPLPDYSRDCPVGPTHNKHMNECKHNTPVPFRAWPPARRTHSESCSLQVCSRIRHVDNEDWSRVLFSDKSRFVLYTLDP